MLISHAAFEEVVDMLEYEDSNEARLEIGFVLEQVADKLSENEDILITLRYPTLYKLEKAMTRDVSPDFLIKAFKFIYELLKAG
jgi:hypothetical protein